MRQYRTVLEQKIRERRQTFEEFAETLETFAREHGERGTLSVRHLQRLASGKGPNGRPLGLVQPTTARLLEHIFGVSIDFLLAPPEPQNAPDADAELHQRLSISRQVDDAMLNALRQSLDGIRRLDRQMGAVVAHEEVKTKVNQVADLLTYSLARRIREQLAALLSELFCLAGWQALDLGRTVDAWRYYDDANKAAVESGIPSFMALAAAGRAFVLVDINETSTASELAAAVRAAADRTCPPMLRTWIAAAHGETLAANGHRDDSLHAFDRAFDLLPTDGADDTNGPYVALDQIHLSRWRGNALANFGESEAVDVLTRVLECLDKSFVRAETAARVDLAMAFASLGEKSEARNQVNHAGKLAAQLCSFRQKRRLSKLAI